MRARHIISSGGFSPEDVIYLTDALESVWRDVEALQKCNGLDRATAREGLALTILCLSPRSAHLSAEEFCYEVKRAFLEQAQLSLSALG
jgi:hypothetical protein